MEVTTVKYVCDVCGNSFDSADGFEKVYVTIEDYWRNPRYSRDWDVCSEDCRALATEKIGVFLGLTAKPKPIEETEPPAEEHEETPHSLGFAEKTTVAEPKPEPDIFNPTLYSPDFSGRVQRLMVIFGYDSNAALARKADVGNSTLSRILNNQIPYSGFRIGVLRRLARTLRCDLVHMTGKDYWLSINPASRSEGARIKRSIKAEGKL